METRVLLISRADVQRLLRLDECITAVEHAFRALGEGRAGPPGVLGMSAGEETGGGFHVKAALLALDRPYFAAKVNANYPSNPERRGLPAIQGAVVLFDAGDGRLLAVMDSMEITALRTAAATAVAAKHLANPDAATLAVCGCGFQAGYQVRALLRVLPGVRRLRLWDVRRDRAVALARGLNEASHVRVEVCDSSSTALSGAQVIVTCTPSERWYVGRFDVGPGAFIAAVGADSGSKQEIEPELLASSAVVVDVLEQAAVMGDVHHALELGLMTRADVRAELGEVVAGSVQGRSARDEVVVFDSTGVAVQDVAAAARVYELALRDGEALGIALGS